MEALLDGMMAQTYRHWELVIADAGGAEETVCDWAQKKGIKVCALPCEAKTGGAGEKLPESMQDRICE